MKIQLILSCISCNRQMGNKHSFEKYGFAPEFIKVWNNPEYAKMLTILRWSELYFRDGYSRVLPEKTRELCNDICNKKMGAWQCQHGFYVHYHNSPEECPNAKWAN